VNIRVETNELEIMASEFEEKKTNLATTAVSQAIDEVLSPLTFLRVVQGVFPTYDFHGYKVDGFVDELVHIKPEITMQQLESALIGNKDTLENYKTFQNDEHLNNLNPYTTIRHALYLSDRESYRSILFDMQRKNFDEWLQKEPKKK